MQSIFILDTWLFGVHFESTSNHTPLIYRSPFKRSNQIKPFSPDNPCGFYVVTLFNHTPIFCVKWQDMEFKMDTKKTCVIMGLTYVLKYIDTIINVIINMIERIYARSVFSLCDCLKISRIVLFNFASQLPRLNFKRQYLIKSILFTR